MAQFGNAVFPVTGHVNENNVMNSDLNLVPISEWMPQANRPVTISGPCSAESEQQVMTTARQLAATGKIDLLRAGIWKPRTRPNSFEGVGTPGLGWLKAAGNAVNLPVTTEVANARHVELCLKAGIDILWVGARTTVNPFSVQEIADALRGVDIPVMIKNPVNPDLQLWVGALERMNQAGITKLAAIHRGFSSFERSAFRNAPKWELPIELKRRYPDLDVFCDPSHISGNRELISMIAQKALDLDMTGLMIESHMQPAVALSDAEQQVTPAHFSRIMSELTIRLRDSSNKDFKTRLDDLRQNIDELDETIFQQISARMEVVENIGKYKKANNVTILQIERWEEVMRRCTAMGISLDLSEDFIRKYLQLIHQESIRRQTAIMNKTETL